MDPTVWVTAISMIGSIAGIFVGRSRAATEEKRELQGRQYDMQLEMLDDRVRKLLPPRPPEFPPPVVPPPPSPPLIDPTLPADVREWLRDQLILAEQLPPRTVLRRIPPVTHVTQPPTLAYYEPSTTTSHTPPGADHE